MKLLYKQNKQMSTERVIYHDAFTAGSNGILSYANRWIEFDAHTLKYTPCKWGQRLQPCNTFDQARKEMVAFDVIQRLDRA